METVKKVERRRALIYPTLIGLGIAGFASCTDQLTPPAQTVAIGPRQPPPLPRRQHTVPLPARKPSPPPENVANPSQSEGEASIPDSATEANPPRAGGEAVALAAPQARPPALDRSKLVGLDQPAARRLLGAATEQSEAPPATIWRYRTANCELDLFFYLDLRSGKMRTLNYAFKGGQGGSEDCLRSVVAARSS